MHALCNHSYSLLLRRIVASLTWTQQRCSLVADNNQPLFYYPETAIPVPQDPWTLPSRTSEAGYEQLYAVVLLGSGIYM